MSLNPPWRGFVSTLLVLSLTTPAWAQVQPAQILAIRPKIDDGPFTTPNANQLPNLTVTVMKAPSGYLLADKDGTPIRKFYDADGDNRVDTWCFYKDKEEVYREQITKSGYSFRWMGPGGTKWGLGTVDGAQKAKIEQWKMISADEAAQEAFLALTTGDFDRMKALFISADEMQALGLSANERAALAKLQENAPAKFQATRKAVQGLPQAEFSRLEGAQPGCYLAENTGAAQDVIKARGLILFENKNAVKKHDYLHSGTLIQVGNAWRFTDVPTPEDGGGGVKDDQYAKLLEVLTEHDKTNPGSGAGFGPWTLQRVAILSQILKQKISEKEKEDWTKQAFDNLSTAAIGGHKESAAEFGKWKTVVAAGNPNSCLVGYATYRELNADYQIKLTEAKGTDAIKVQDGHIANLVAFVNAFPTCDDTPEALIQVAMGYEFAGKDAEAKKYLNQLVAKFPATPGGQKATGAIRRLDAVGQKFELAGPTFNNGPKYDVKNSKGKVVVVYYWASFATQAAGDFAALKKVQAAYPKDVEIVCVNLDNKAGDADVLRAKSPPGPHLHDGGGMNGPLASHYGIFALPHAFVIDRDGNVAQSKMNVGALDEEIERLTKK